MPLLRIASSILLTEKWIVCHKSAKTRSILLQAKMNFNLGGPSSSSSSSSSSDDIEAQLMANLEAIDAEQEAIITYHCNIQRAIAQYLNQQNYPSLQSSKSDINFCHNNISSSSSSSGSLVKASMAASAESTEITKPLSVLFVCLGNICRSPAAEGVFRDIVTMRGLDSKFHIDSAGTIDYHEGNLADPRMRAASKRRGVEITSISRPIRSSDFKDFYLILAMDKQNRDDIMDSFNRWKFRETLPEDAHKKVKLMCSYCKRHDETEVPDPYYGGPQGFEKVLDILEDACESLLDNIVAENGPIFGS